MVQFKKETGFSFVLPDLLPGPQLVPPGFTAWIYIIFLYCLDL